VIHAGAGEYSARIRGRETDWCDALRRALARAQAVLERGGEALDAAQAAVAFMEDEADMFNAGRGSALCSDGSVEMSAALMRGSDRAAGAVAGIRHSRHPCAVARAVLESEQVLLIGARADEAGALAGVEQCESSYFVTDDALERLGEREQALGHATVGAVCLDAHGVLAAATSTGGISGQPPGRVGDTPIIGAGTWADRAAAVSCTGKGEAFVRSGAGRQVAALVGTGVELERAAEQALADVAAVKGDGGLIAVDISGKITMPFSTEVMPRGIWRPGRDPEVAIGARDAWSPDVPL
jgi:beta-aspartyl-peptidase (threonine type)